MLFKDVDTVLFDLDGTLLDSVSGIVTSFLHTLETFEIKNPPKPEEIVASLGMPLAHQMYEFSGHSPKAPEMVRFYMEHNQKIIPTMELFPGALDTICALKDKGYKVGVVTAKYRSSATLSFEKFKFSEIMDVLVTGNDTEKHKPEPEPLFFAMDKIKSSSERTVYVGDATFDIRSARAAKCYSVAALWGPNSKDVLSKEEPHVMCENFDELMSHL